MHSRVHWKPEEDEKLQQLVEQIGPHNWNIISKNLQGRSGKSCRARWAYQLDPTIKRERFTPEEEDRLLAEHSMHGNNWALIAQNIPGRTGNALKNHWHVLMRRRRKNQSGLSEKGSGEHPLSNAQIDLSSIIPESFESQEENKNNFQSETSKPLGKDGISSPKQVGGDLGDACTSEGIAKICCPIVGDNLVEPQRVGK